MTPLATQVSTVRGENPEQLRELLLTVERRCRSGVVHAGSRNVNLSATA